MLPRALRLKQWAKQELEMDVKVREGSNRNIYIMCSYTRGVRVEQGKTDDELKEELRAGGSFIPR